MSNIIYLGVNIDHVATVRQARGVNYPDPLQAALLAEKAGADGITLHLREDRRHIIDSDVFRLKQAIGTRMNLEMAVTDEMLSIACEVKPTHCCLVPERREELTTEGGLDVVGQIHKIKNACQQLQNAGIAVSLFIDPEQAQIAAAKECGADAIEIHTGAYADATTDAVRDSQWQRINQSVQWGVAAGLIVNAGHGLHYENVGAIAAITDINELNIGHSIVAEALMVGFFDAVQTMKQLMLEARV